MRDISFTAPAAEWRPTIITDTLSEASLTGYRSTPIAQGLPSIVCAGVNDVQLVQARASAGARALLTLQGDANQNVLVTGCDLRGAAGPAVGNTHGLIALYNLT